MLRQWLASNLLHVGEVRRKLALGKDVIPSRWLGWEGGGLGGSEGGWVGGRGSWVGVRGVGWE